MKAENDKQYRKIEEGEKVKKVTNKQNYPVTVEHTNPKTNLRKSSVSSY